MSIYSDKLFNWSVDLLKRFHLANMSGSITIYFNDGIVCDTETKIKQKPPFDKLK